MPRKAASKPRKAASKKAWKCGFCPATLAKKSCLDNHIKLRHPDQWAGPVTRYRCPRRCPKMQVNFRLDKLNDHMSSFHGVDIPAKMRSTKESYLKRKKNEFLRQDIAHDSAELNQLNAKIRHAEHLLLERPPPFGIQYQSFHGLDVATTFETDPAKMPKDKTGLVRYLQDVRNARNEQGQLCTKAGVMDTREAVLKELETLLILT